MNKRLMEGIFVGFGIGLGLSTVKLILTNIGPSLLTFLTIFM